METPKTPFLSNKMKQNKQIDEILGALSAKPELAKRESLMRSIGVEIKFCKKCYERGHLGLFTSGSISFYLLCDCVKKAVINRKPIDINKTILKGKTDENSIQSNKPV